jgi:hypothetical protein
VIGNRARDKQDISISRSGRNEKSKPMNIVMGFVELFDFAQASPACAGIDNPDVQRLFECAPQCGFAFALLPLGPLKIILPLNTTSSTSNAPKAMDASAPIH